jgi:transposase
MVHGYGLRSDQARLPKEASKRETLARQIGADGFQLLEWVLATDSPPGLSRLPALEALRQIWLQQYYRCTVPGLAELRWRTKDEQPPSAVRIAAPYDLEARYSSKRDTHWVGYKLHLTETCDPGQPDLITQVITTPATTPDCVMGPTIHHDLAQRDLLPGTHLLDSGYVDADLLVTAQTQHQIDVVGPPFGSYSRQRRAGEGYDLQAFVIDWDAQQAHCPQGHTSVNWRPGHDVSGDPVIRIRFDGATCRACPTRQACTSARGAPRQLTIRLQSHHEALQAARQRQETPEFKAQYALRAGVESSLSQGVRCFGLRRSRYLGLARTHLQLLLTATAMNIVRVIAWLRGEPLGERRRQPGPFAQLAPYSLSRQAVLC